MGASGAGKSTLLLALAGVLPEEGTQQGRLEVNGVPPSQLKGHAGLVMQDPESQLVAARLGDDVAFGCENMGVPPEQIWPRVKANLDAVGLKHPLDHPTNHLSGGEQQRLILAGGLAMGADLLLLDEPTSNLDRTGIDQVRDAVCALLANRRHTLIVIEHHHDLWRPLVDRVINLPSSTPYRLPVSTIDNHSNQTNIYPFGEGENPPTKRRPTAPIVKTKTAWNPRTNVLTGRNLSVGYQATVVRSGLDVVIPEGVSTVITGANGSGKTTLAWTLAGLLPPLDGYLEAAASLTPPARGRTLHRSPHTWKSRELLSRIGMVFQSPDHQFVAGTVFDEIATGLRALKTDKTTIATNVNSLLERIQLAHLKSANPYTLSGGERRRLSVATVLACNPRVIVLDEPTFGQDDLTWTGLVELIRQLREQGTTIISVTHDQDYIEALGEHLIELGDRP
jgi:energy-coupling factor transport system ATP-binding protein